MRVCFNGAVVSQPRKAREPIATVSSSLPLQWGRGFSATEGGVCSSNHPGGMTLQWGRGFSATEGDFDSRETFVFWMLQWGRGFSATEGSTHG